MHFKQNVTRVSQLICHSTFTGTTIEVRWLFFHYFYYYYCVYVYKFHAFLHVILMQIPLWRTPCFWIILFLFFAVVGSAANQVSSYFAFTWRDVVEVFFWYYCCKNWGNRDILWIELLFYVKNEGICVRTYEISMAIRFWLYVCIHYTKDFYENFHLIWHWR